jgi:hypothetical protein
VQDTEQSSQPSSKGKEPEKLAATTSSVKWREVKVQRQLDKFKDKGIWNRRMIYKCFWAWITCTLYTTTIQQSNTRRERRDREEKKIIIGMIYFGVSDLYQYIVKGCDSVREVINELDATFLNLDI